MKALTSGRDQLPSGTCLTLHLSRSCHHRPPPAPNPHSQALESCAPGSFLPVSVVLKASPSGPSCFCRQGEVSRRPHTSSSCPWPWALICRQASRSSPAPSPERKSHFDLGYQTSQFQPKATQPTTSCLVRQSPIGPLPSPRPGGVGQDAVLHTYPFPQCWRAPGLVEPNLWELLKLQKLQLHLGAVCPPTRRLAYCSDCSKHRVTVS